MKEPDQVNASVEKARKELERVDPQLVEAIRRTPVYGPGGSRDPVELARVMKDLGVLRFEVEGLKVEFHPAAVVKREPLPRELLEAGRLNAIAKDQEGLEKDQALAEELAAS